LDHELVHVLLGRSFAPNHPPQWLQEGLAQLFAGEYTPDTTRRLARGLIGRQPIDLEALQHGFPSDPIEADLAYAQSADFMAWMRGRYGDDSIHRLIGQLAGGAEIGAAIRRATGSWLEDVEGEWRSDLNSGVPLSFSAFQDFEIFWAFGGLLLVFGGISARLRLNRRMREMEEEENRMDEMLDDLMAAVVEDRPLVR